MEGKVGDRVLIDAKKVGQPRRAGVISGVSKGLSGLRYRIRWDDGSETVLAPGAGNMTVRAKRGGKGAARANGKRTAPKAAPKKAAKKATKKTAKAKRKR